MRVETPSRARKPSASEVGRLPPEGGSLPVERTEQVLGLGAGEGWFPRDVVVSHAENVATAYDRNTFRDQLTTPRCRGA